MKPKAIRCVSSSKHANKYAGENRAHNLLAVVEGDCIYIKCPDRGCKRWNKIELHVPGMNLDFSQVAFTHDVMPEGFVFGNTIGKYMESPKRITEVIRET